MTLDEAIVHATEKAGSCTDACQQEHAQLAKWLTELKKLRQERHADTELVTFIAEAMGEGRLSMIVENANDSIDGGVIFTDFGDAVDELQKIKHQEEENDGN